MIHIENLHKSYGKIKALDSLSLHVERGEIHGLFGPDGSGKTSLMKIITTLIPFNEGNVLIDGYNIVKYCREIRHSIGYMPDCFSLNGLLTVNENIRLYATLFGMTMEDELHIIEPVYRFLRPFGNRRASLLSGGMKQKLALCCALIHRPRLLLLDEPTTGIDAVSRMELWDLLVEQNQKTGLTILVSTPYRNELKRCTRVTKVEKGKAIATGIPSELLEEEETFERVHGLSEKDKIINVHGLTKKFGDFTAVNGIDLKIGRGEIFGFLGANGAGKTTAIRMLCGLSVPTKGEGKVAGYDIISENEKVKRHIGYMSQKFSLFQDLTLMENCEFVAGIYGIERKKAREIASRLLDEMGFSNIHDRMVSSLPLGWKQRLAFTVAMLHSPYIIFLDEPTSGVDAQSRREIWQYIIQMANKGNTIFVTTHYMDEAMYCDRIAIMADGNIKDIGAPQKLIEKHHVSDMNELFSN